MGVEGEWRDGLESALRWREESFGNHSLSGRDAAPDEETD
jgi:hypothetical protein